MSAPSEKPDDAEALFRTLLGEWAGRIEGNPVPDFAQKVAIVSITDRTVHAGFLRCLFDVRGAPAPKFLAYRESSPPVTADRNDLWGIPSGLNRQYLEQETEFVAAEPGAPQACTRCGDDGACEKCRGGKTVPCAACGSRGRKSCPACGGRGIIVCAQCAGRGKVLLSVAPDGTRQEDDCPQCTGKKELPCHDCADAAAADCAACANKRAVACPACEGRGTPLCPQCGGTRRVVQGFSVSIAYKLAYFRSLTRDPSIPESVFPEDPAWGKLGATVLELEADGGAPLADKKPDGAAGEAFAKVLAQAAAAAPGANSKLIMQTVSVERIPVYDVAYSFAGKEYRAWASGFENRLTPVGDPFADQAVRWADEAESLLEKGEFAAFEERAAQAAALAPKNPAVAALRGKAGAVQRRAALVFGAKVSAGLAVAAPALLALVYRSPNRFPPLAALALVVAGAAFAGAFTLAGALARRPLLPPKRRNGLAAAAAAGGAVLAVAAFAAVGPIRRIDARAFAAEESKYEGLPFPNWSEADDAGLAALVKDYAARGVDVSAGQDLLDRRASFVAAARAQALADEKAREEAARRKAEAAARQKALAAKRLAAAKAAAAKEKAKAKKAKKKAGSNR